MKRLPQRPRPDWQRRLEHQGFHFHSIDPEGEDRAGQGEQFLYWREDVAYEFGEQAIERLYEAVRELHAMSVETAGELVRRGDLARLGLPPAAQALVERSWRRGDPHLYGRFDLSWDGAAEPRLLEYNADTPTSIIETAVAQWNWLQDVHPGADQFNSLHEALVERLGTLARERGLRSVHLAGLLDCQEDCGNLEYLLDIAVQAGLQASLIDMNHIGRTPQGGFVDLDDRPIECCFKLYPWEWMAGEAFGDGVLDAPTVWLEPAWKMALSNKALLALLWERHPGHPNLLPAYFSPEPFGRAPYVKKPLLSREGANVEFVHDGVVSLKTEGGYGAEGHVYQAAAPLPAFAAPEATSWHGPLDAVHAVVGAWVVGDEAVGMAVREDVTPVTSNTAYFVPHFFRPGT
ncbi:glutathionylspermidine synthase [Rubrivivax gelatinosus]|nr:glutathionylspermidine synthase [Rubrivivax gelatinosus]